MVALLSCRFRGQDTDSCARRRLVGAFEPVIDAKHKGWFAAAMSNSTANGVFPSVDLLNHKHRGTPYITYLSVFVRVARVCFGRVRSSIVEKCLAIYCRWFDRHALR
jgi:hypothetical protein